ncbi:MAG: esterase, partial [Oxalobacteraceae bacterium]
IKGVPMLWVWGDNLGKFPFWGRIAAQQDKFRANLLKAGGKADRIVLPEIGVQGNSHMLMMDRNSDQIAGLIDRWLIQQNLKR